jgi:uncharacterized membrane protein YecN with MAPEG domain
MSFPITAPTAALLTLIYVPLTLAVIKTRTKAGIGLGEGGNALILEAVRRQANFVENVPLALILMALAEAGGANATMLKACAVVLIHPFGIRVDAPSHPARIVGAVATTGVLLVLTVVLAVQFFA